jgi:hypothetical protein
MYLSCAVDLRDMYVYDVTKLAWTNLSSSTKNPPSAGESSLTLAGGKVYMIRGSVYYGKGGSDLTCPITYPNPKQSFESEAILKFWAILKQIADCKFCH